MLRQPRRKENNHAKVLLLFVLLIAGIVVGPMIAAIRVTC